ncbi:MAG: glycoside hydrolase family 28 protein, partial [Paludibacteraceae bacterium]|nr:glycoside hydrolase family 28 protein [Paludibacteraceae bacterium]
MKKSFFTLVALVCGALCLQAENPYDAYYQDLPIDIEHVQPVTFPDTTVNMKVYFRQYGITNADVLATEAFQKAIDELSAAGGGHVVVPRGTWKTGPLTLRSNIDLHLNKGAVMLFSEDKSLYMQPDSKGRVPSKANPCISGKNLENVGITGQGVI